MEFFLCKNQSQNIAPTSHLRKVWAMSDTAHSMHLIIRIEHNEWNMLYTELLQYRQRLMPASLL